MSCSERCGGERLLGPADGSERWGRCVCRAPCGRAVAAVKGSRLGAAHGGRLRRVLGSTSVRWGPLRRATRAAVCPGRDHKCPETPVLRADCAAECA